MPYEEELETLEYYLYMTACEAAEGKPNVEYNPFSSENEPPQDENEEENLFIPE